MCVARFLCAALFRSYAPPQAVLSVAPFTFWIEHRVFSSVSDPCRSSLPMSSLHYCPQWTISFPGHTIFGFLSLFTFCFQLKCACFFLPVGLPHYLLRFNINLSKKKNVLFITPSKVIQGYFVTCHMGTTSAQFMLHTRLQMPGRPELFSINLS